MPRILLCLFLAAFASACTKNKQEKLAEDTATSGAFELVADETLKPAIDSLVIGFNSQTPNAKVTVRYNNATDALDELLQGKARLVLIARPLGMKERDLLASQKIELTEADVAESSIGVIVSIKNPLQTLSMDTLKDVVGGSDKNFIRISSSYLSSTEFALDSIFGLNKYQEGRMIRYQTSDSIIDRVRKDDHAIGFVNASWLKQLSGRPDTSIRVLNISGVSDRPIMLHLAYILQKLYPLCSRICAYTKEVPNTLPRGFLAYAMSADGQRVFLNYDLLPKTQILKLVPPQNQ